MKKISIIVALMAVSSGALAAGGDIHAEFAAMMDRSFKTTGIADKHRMNQLDFQKELGRRGIPIHYDVEDLQADLRTLAALNEK